MRTANQLLAQMPEPTSRSTWALQTPVLESLVTHARNLVNFLYPARVQSTDVIANDFFSGTSSWNALVPENAPDLLEKFRRRANREVAHLTIHRISGRPDRKAYKLEIFEEIEQTLLVFAEHSSVELLPDEVKQLILNGNPPVDLAQGLADLQQATRVALPPSGTYTQNYSSEFIVLSTNRTPPNVRRPRIQ